MIKEIAKRNWEKAVKENGDVINEDAYYIARSDPEWDYVDGYREAVEALYLEALHNSYTGEEWK